jgi:hypothetical protein
MTTQPDTPSGASTPITPRAALHTSADLQVGVHAMLTHQGYTPDEITAAAASTHAPGCELTSNGWDCMDEDGQSRHPLSDEIYRLSDLLDVALSAIAEQTPSPYDRDPAALAWARGKVEDVIDGVTRLLRLVGQTRPPTDAALLVRYADWLRRDFLHGGPNLAAFDLRHAQETE